MRIARMLDITPDKFFDYLEQRVPAEIERACGERHGASVLRAGHRYASDPDDRYQRSEVALLACECETEYSSSTITLIDDATMCCRVELRGAGTIGRAQGSRTHGKGMRHGTGQSRRQDRDHWRGEQLHA